MRALGCAMRIARGAMLYPYATVPQARHMLLRSQVVRSSSSHPPVLRNACEKQWNPKDNTAMVCRTNAGHYASYNYGFLLNSSSRFASHVVKSSGAQAVAFLMPPNMNWVVSMWGAWRAGAVAVPLCTKHTVSELVYSIETAKVDALYIHESFSETAEQLKDKLASSVDITITYCPELDGESSSRTEAMYKIEGGKMDTDMEMMTSALPDVSPSNGALIIYTSGTTSKPKAVLTSHAALQQQVSNLIKAWGWQRTDRTLNTLPLHHIHGAVNVVTCATACGAAVEMPSGFNAKHVFDRLAGLSHGGSDAACEPGCTDLTVFMAVPTIYAKLIQEYDSRPQEEQAFFTESTRKLRLMVSGSAALPTPIMTRWAEITGHVLLERYGMTETGMILGNPLDMSKRKIGSVGVPFDSVNVKLVADDATVLYYNKEDKDAIKVVSSDGSVSNEATDMSGLLFVKGGTLFSEYFGNEKATKESFDSEGYFDTGDVVRFCAEDHTFDILGRASADIIKSGGYKLSALEIERAMLGLAFVREVAVLGVEDPEWGERVAAVVVSDGSDVTPEILASALKDELSKYKMPTIVKVVDEIPRNAMGKVNKKQLKAAMF